MEVGEDSIPVVRTRALCRSFADLPAVAGLDLEIQPGEVYGLLGPNGAGKTTTIRMLTTLLTPTSGRAWVCGYDVVSEPDEVRRRIGYAMQQVPSRWNMTGREILEIEAALYHVPRRRVRERVAAVLDVTGLESAADRLFQHYSGGMSKRLDLACALLNRPRLLVLDEPTLGLDVPSRQQVWEHLAQLRAAGVTVLLATNYLDEADRLCDRLMIVDEGRTVATGTPAELKRGVGGDLLKVSTGQREQLATALADHPWAERVVISDDAVHVRVEDAPRQLPELLAVCTRAGVAVTGVTYTQPTLDDVFLLHTGAQLREQRPAAGVA